MCQIQVSVVPQKRTGAVINGRGFFFHIDIIYQMGSRHSLIAPDGKLYLYSWACHKNLGLRNVLVRVYVTTYGCWTHCEAWCELLDVIQRNVDPHHAQNQLILVLRGKVSEKKRWGWNVFSSGPTSADSQSLCCSSLCVPHLAVPVVFGLCFIEDGKRPGDDQTQFLMESQEKAPFISSNLVKLKLTGQEQFVRVI